MLLCLDLMDELRVIKRGELSKAWWLRFLSIPVFTEIRMCASFRTACFSAMRYPSRGKLYCMLWGEGLD